jgi:hypothetical protein
MGEVAYVPEGRCDRSLARSAWDRATQKSRPVGYGLIRAGVRTDSMVGVTKSNGSYRTLRDGPLGGRFPRHFVPGYDHAVPLGRNRFFAQALIKLAS